MEILLVFGSILLSSCFCDYPSSFVTNLTTFELSFVLYPDFFIPSQPRVSRAVESGLMMLICHVS